MIKQRDVFIHRKSHTGLEWHKDESIIRKFLFWVNYPFKWNLSIRTGTSE